MSSSGVQVLGSLLGAFAIAYALDFIISQKKVFGGSIPRTFNREWREETERKLHAWPRTAGPPVAVNPVRRQNFTVNSRSDA